MRTAILLPFALLACSATEPDPTNADANEIRLEQTPMPTSLTELRAGQAYLPGVDEAPIVVGAPCVQGAQITVTNGQVASAASVVQTRHNLTRELGFNLNGMLPIVGALTGAASLAANTTFDDRSAVILFQSTGTYESALSSASALPAFDAAATARCGYGYVTRASHRVTAALVVTVRSTTENRELKANAGIGQSSTADAKANISNLIKRGNLDISIRYAADVIPGLPAAPLADSVFVGDSETEKQAAIAKLDRSLSWLASAQSSIEGYLSTLRSGTETPPAAPTQNVRFRFYPNTPSAIRMAVEKATDSANAARAGMARADAGVDSWAAFDEALRADRGHEWNLPAAPATTVADLADVRRRLFEGNDGTLSGHRRALEDLLDACVRAIRNEDAKAGTELGAAITDTCKPPPAFPLEESEYDVRQIAAISIDDTVNRPGICPAGQRIPTESEAPLFYPWSSAIAASNRGIWTFGRSCPGGGSAWIFDGDPACSGPYADATGLQICLSEARGPFAPRD